MSLLAKTVSVLSALCLQKGSSFNQAVIHKTSAIDCADFLNRTRCGHVEIWRGGTYSGGFLSAELKVKFVHA